VDRSRLLIKLLEILVSGREPRGVDPALRFGSEGPNCRRNCFRGMNPLMVTWMRRGPAVVAKLTRPEKGFRFGLLFNTKGRHVFMGPNVWFDATNKLDGRASGWTFPEVVNAAFRCQTSFCKCGRIGFLPRRVSAPGGRGEQKLAVGKGAFPDYRRLMRTAICEIPDCDSRVS